jgi:hypothetical protein
MRWATRSRRSRSASSPFAIARNRPSLPLRQEPDPVGAVGRGRTLCFYPRVVGLPTHPQSQPGICHRLTPPNKIVQPGIGRTERSGIRRKLLAQRVALQARLFSLSLRDRKIGSRADGVVLRGGFDRRDVGY